MPLPDFESADEVVEETDGGEEGTQTTESLDDKLTKVQERVSQTVQQGLQQNQQLVNLLADPDIQQVLRRKQQGLPVQVAEPTETEEPEPNFDEMSQKEIVAYMGKQNQKLVQQTVLEAIKPLVQQVQSVQGTVRQTQEEKAVQMVQAAAQKFSDFDQHRNRMVQLSESLPNATPEQLYVMAVTEAGKTPQLRKAMQQRAAGASSERPSHTTARPGAKPVPKGMNSREAFNFAMSNALKNIDSTGLDPNIE